MQDVEHMKQEGNRKMVEIEYDQEISKVERNQELAIILKKYDTKSNQ